MEDIWNGHLSVWERPAEQKGKETDRRRYFFQPQKPKTQHKLTQAIIPTCKQQEKK